MSQTDSLARLRSTRGLAREVGTAVEEAVMAARADGATWEQIGEALGMTKQGAHYRFGRIDDEDEPEVLA